jgi:hypothetical protein
VQPTESPIDLFSEILDLMSIGHIRLKRYDAPSGISDLLCRGFERPKVPGCHNDLGTLPRKRS